jgi:hypothetical protein
VFCWREFGCGVVARVMGSRVHGGHLRVLASASRFDVAGREACFHSARWGRLLLGRLLPKSGAQEQRAQGFEGCASSRGEVRREAL